MYAIYGNIYHQYTPNVSIYTIHGSYGSWFASIQSLSPGRSLWPSLARRPWTSCWFCRGTWRSWGYKNENPNIGKAPLVELPFGSSFSHIVPTLYNYIYIYILYTYIYICIPIKSHEFNFHSISVQSPFRSDQVNNPIKYPLNQSYYINPISIYIAKYLLRKCLGYNLL